MKRRNPTRASAPAALLALAFLIVLTLPPPSPVKAGGPLVVGGGSTGGFGPDGVPFVWMTLPIPYTTDGGNLGKLTNAEANTRVANMFQAWQDVPTSTIAFTRTGGVSATKVPDGDVNTMQEFNDLGCTGNPVIYDADGSLFTALGRSAGVIGFAGPCGLNSAGALTSGRIALNGKFIDNDTSNRELTDNEFDAVFIHEFGHFFGLDHSQINNNCLTDGCASGSDDAFGMPTMFPILISGLTETPGVHPARTLSADDIAWVSFLYPEPSFASSLGTITGNVFFSDGVTGVQGANVIARRIDDPATPTIDESRRFAVSVVSGYLFTETPGNSLVNEPRSSFGSMDPTWRGFYRIPGLPAPTTPTAYRVDVESVNAGFTGGSSVGSLDPPIPLPGPPEFYGGPESSTDNPTFADDINVIAGLTESNKNIILNGTPARFDTFDAFSRNDGRTTATPIGTGTLRGSLSPFETAGGDQDFYSFNAAAGTIVTFEIVSRRAPLNTKVDSVLEILDSTGVRPATCRTPATPTGPFTEACLNDDIDAGVIQDSRLEFKPAASGTFFVHVSEFRGDARPDFQYDLSLSVARETSSNPVPTLSSLSPSSVAAGIASFTLTVTGSDFVPGAVVRWNGGDHTTTFVSSTQLTATILASDVAAAGTPQVNVFNPAPGGGLSSSLTFRITTTAPGASILPSTPFTRIVPHYVTGENFVTKMTVANLSASQNPILVNFVSQAGSLLETQTFVLAPAASIRVETPESARTTSSTRWVVVGSQFDVGINLFFELKNTGTNQMVTTVGFSDVPPVSSFVLPVELEPARPGDPAPRTVGLALANVSSSSNTITLSLKNAAGTVLATETLPLGPFAQTAFNVESLASFRAALPAGNFIGVVSVSATQPVSAIGVGDDFGPFFSVPIMTGRTGTLLIPHFVTGDGFVTKMTIVNVSASSNPVVLKFFSQSGALLLTQNFTLPPGGSQRIATPESERFTSPTTRWATLDAPQLAGVNLFFELRAPTSPLIVTTVGFNEVPGLADFTLPLELETVRPADPAPRTVGLALANNSSSTNTVTLKLVDRSGTVLATQTLTLGPFFQTAFNVENLTSFRPALPPGNFIGAVTVAGTGPLSAIGVGDDFGPFFSIPIIPGRAR